MSRWKIRVPVIFPGKVATTLLFTGFAGLLLNFPQIPGLGITSVSWLPGFTSEYCSWGIWFVYAGLVLTVFTTSYYVARGRYLQKKAEAAERALLNGESSSATDSDGGSSAGAFSEESLQEEFAQDTFGQAIDLYHSAVSAADDQRIEDK